MTKKFKSHYDSTLAYSRAQFLTSSKLLAELLINVVNKTGVTLTVSPRFMAQFTGMLLNELPSKTTYMVNGEHTLQMLLNRRATFADDGDITDWCVDYYDRKSGSEEMTGHTWPSNDLASTVNGIERAFGYKVNAELLRGVDMTRQEVAESRERHRVSETPVTIGMIEDAFNLCDDEHMTDGVRQFIENLKSLA